MNNNGWRQKPLVRAIVLSNCWLLIVSAPLYAAPPPPNQLPIPANVLVNLNQGAATINTVGNNMTVNQTSNKAILNWKSFNIGKDGNVQFVQPSADAIALNKIGDSSATQIFGQLGANGTIYLINNNGILFGQGAQVNVHGLVASTLNIDDNQFLNSSLSQAINNGNAALNGGSANGAMVTVESGAKIQTDSGGQVLMFAPSVVNAGEISTPDGQTILAASKDKVYLALSDNNPSLRGLLVEVDSGGDVTNVGKIVAERGNITLMGLAVNQNGRLTATTSVDVNGSIRLIARDKAKIPVNPSLEGVLSSTLVDDRTDDQGHSLLPTQTTLAIATETGAVTLGSGSVTEVVADSNGKTAADAQPQNISRVDLIGKSIEMQSGSSIAAKSGKVNLVATTTPDKITISDNLYDHTEQTDSRIYIGANSKIDVSGENVQLDMSRRVIAVELRADELKDAPLQRNGFLHGKTVMVDIDKGSPLISDLAPSLAKIQRDVKERSMAGGSINFSSQGDVLFGGNAVMNIAGGSATYKSGIVNTTKLLSNGRIFDIGSADPSRQYDGIFGEHTETHPKWGKTVVGQNSLFTKGTYRQGFTEGKSGGALNIDAQAAYGFDLATIQAGATVGINQRDLSKMPQGGSILVKLGQGPETSLLSNVQNAVIAKAQQSALLNIGDSYFWNGIIPADFNISAEQLNRSGAGSFTLLTNGAVKENADAVVSLNPGAKIDLTGTGIDIEGALRVSSGTINLTSARSAADKSGGAGVKSYDLSIGSNALLDASGIWINDVLKTGSAIIPLAIDGGTLSLSANGQLSIAQGAQLRSNAGAQLTAAGKFIGGKGGNISLADSRTDGNWNTIPINLNLAGNLSALGFSNGGSFSLSALGIGIGAKPENSDNETFWFSPDYFNGNGFSSYSLSASLNDVDVSNGTTVHLTQNNRQITSLKDASRIATGGDINSFSYTALLPDFQRKPVSLSLKANNGSVSLDRDSVIALEPQAALNISANKNIAFDGTIAARGASVSATIITATNNEHYDAGQMIWLGPTAVIDARATHIAQIDAQGRDIGKIYDGGDVVFTANRGSIVAAPGSNIDVSGASFVTSILGSHGQLGKTVTNASAGGISFTAANGIVVYADLLGQSVGDGLGGGLAYTLDANNIGNVSDFPATTPHSISVSSILPVWDTTIAFGKQLPEAFQNRALVAVDSVQNGKFSQLTLSARNKANGSGELLSYSGIDFTGDTNFSIADLLVLSASNINGHNHSINLSAGLIEVGQQTNALVADQAVDATSVAESITGGSLNFSAKFIELLGNIGISGVKTTNINSSDDVRLRSPIDLSNAGARRVLAASTFSSAGNVSISSSQTYVSTLSDYTFNLTGANSTFTTNNNGASRAPILSAGGKLSINAANVDLGGVLAVPLGTVAITATNSVAMRNGSMIDVSANNLLIPFGRTLGETLSWLYNVSGSLNQPIIIQSALQKSVNISAPSVRMDDGSKINLSGGGDIYAIEQIPGPGGSKDFLDPANSNGAFAVVPWLNSNISPFDQVEMAGFTINGAAPKIGDTIYLDGAAGLPAGNYAILPAHYALMAGAYLVTPKAGNWVQGESATQIDGTQWVSGRYGRAFTGTYDGQWMGFSIEQGSVAKTRSEFKLITGDEFFNGGVKAADAGRATIAATTDLELLGSILGTASENARKAELDLIASQIEIVDAKSKGSNAVQLVAGELNHIGVDSLLIGGSRSTDKDATTINVSADSITVKSGAALSIPDVMLAATNQINVESGASVVGTGSSTATVKQFNLVGDGAFLRATSASQSDVVRTDVSGTSGILTISGNVSADKALLFDATREFNLSGLLAFTPHLVTDTTSLNLTANRISLGDGSSAATDGIKITNAQLAALNPSELRLSSRSSIDVYGDVAISNREVQFNTGALRNMSGGTVQISAVDTLQLDNNIGASESGGVAGGNLTLSASKIELGSDRDRAGTQAIMQLLGFDTVTLGAAGKTTALLGNGNFVLRGDSDANHFTNLTVLADRIGAGANTNSSVVVNGTLTLQGTNPTAADPTAELGGKFALTGKSVVIDKTRIELPSGDVSITASGTDAGENVTIQNGTVIDVAGRNVVFPQGSVIRTSGGNISIQSNNDVVADISVLAKLGDVDQGADAGNLNIIAKGQALWGAFISAHTADGFQGGGLKVTAKNFDQVNLITQLSDFQQWLKTIAGSGLTKSVDLRARSGDIATDSNDPTISSHAITIAADTGNINWNSGLDASGKNGGSIGLYAGNDLTLGANAKLNASATASGGNGGVVELSSNTNLILNNGSQIDVHGNALNIGDSTSALVSTKGRNGNVLLRASRTASNDEVNFHDDGVAITGADRVQLVAFKTYTSTDGTLSDVINNQSALTEAQSFMEDNQSTIKTRIGGIANATNFHLMPGIDVWSDSDLTVDSPVNLNSSHFGGEPGVLTLRAANNINVESDIKDGLKNNSSTNTLNTAAKVFLLPDYSWSYNIVAGADSSAAQYSRVGTSGNLTIDNGFDIITGAGNIALYAAGTIEATDPTTVIASFGRTNYTTYTTYKTPKINVSMPDTGSIDPFYLSSLNTRLPMYPQDGGSVNISAGGDVKFAVGDGVTTTNSFFSDWIDRIANNSLQMGGFSSVPKQTFDITTWGVLLDFVKQGVLALGGGDISVAAGGSVTNLNAATPTTAKQVGSSALTPLNNRIQLIGGGDINVMAGKDVLSPRLFSDRGAINVQSGGRIGAVNVTPTDSNNLTPEDLSAVLVLADTQVNLQARGDVAIESVVNSTALPVSKNMGASSAAVRSVDNAFFTYSSDAKVSISSVGGNIEFVDSTTSVASVFGGNNWPTYQNAGTTGWGRIFALYPGQLYVNAAQGNIEIGDDLTLFPTATGQLNWLAANDITRLSTKAIIVNLSDADPALLPTWNAPVKSIATNAPDAPIKRLDFASAPSLIHAATPVHAGDSSSAVIAALNDIAVAKVDGDVPTDRRLTFAIAKPTRVYAGRDIANISFDIEHANDNQNSEIIAGRDIGFPFSVNTDTGQLITSLDQYIRIEGPGSLDMLAGRNLDLGGSSGIESIGNQKNPALPSHGATLNLLAGINGPTALTDPVLYNSYADHYLTTSTPALSSGSYIAWLQQNSNNDAIDIIGLTSVFSGKHYASRAAALADFAALPVLTQQAISLRAYEQTLGNTADYSANLIAFVSLENFGGDLTGAVEHFTNQNYANNRAAALALAQLPGTQQLQAARIALDSATPAQRRGLLLNVLTSEIHSAGVEGQAGTGGGYARGYAALANMFPGDKWKGDINLVFSTIRTVGDGDINLVVPGGNVNVGLANKIGGLNKGAADLGIITQAYGKINGMASGSFNVNQSRIFSLGGGEVTLWSSNGDIDAGKGAKTALTIPPPRVTQDPTTGAIKLIFSAAVSGSGIQAANSSSSADPTADGAFAADDSIAYGFGEDTRLSRLRFYDSLSKGNANLFAPQGTINAGDAGISVAGNLIIGAQHVVGADNINVGGVALGVPTTTSVSAGTLSMGNAASSATDSATGSMNEAIKQTAAALSEGNVAFVTVDVIGTGR